MRNSILITGASGLLGRRVAGSVCDTHDVHCIVRQMPVNPVDNVTYHIIDLADGNWDESALPKGIDTIMHLAQSQKFRDFPDDALDVFNVNIQSTAKLLDYAVKNSVKSFVYASSGGIYGSGVHAFDENSPINHAGALGYYLGSKLASEILVSSYTEQMDVQILRFFFMYGPEQNKSMLIPRLVNSVRNKNEITLQGSEGIKINPIHVKDASKAAVAAMALEGSYTFNIGGSEIMSLKQIAETIGDFLGIAPVFKHVDSQANHLIGDIEAMKEKLYIPKISFEQGVNDFE